MPNELNTLFNALAEVFGNPFPGKRSYLELINAVNVTFLYTHPE